MIRLEAALLLSLAFCAGTAATMPIMASPAADQVSVWLDAAEAAERTGQLIYPASGSAMSLYHEVLAIEPGNRHAVGGLTRIAEHYLEQAQQALDQFALLRADLMLSRARMVYPDYPGIAAVAGQLALLEGAERTRQSLDWRAVANRSPTLLPTLKRLGSRARGENCRVVIQVSNDAEGRWVYQQLRESPGEGRIRARVVIASPAAVEILCFES